MSENTVPPKPEEMGEHLDQEIKDTVHDWAQNPEASRFEDLDERIDEKLRRRIASWVGAPEDADWKTIGARMDASTREAIGRWVGAEPDADWGTISSRMEGRIRRGIARLVHAAPAAPSAEAEAAPDASWSDIGAKIERDVRGWIGEIVGAGEQADWKTIGDQVLDQVRVAFNKVAQSARKREESAPQGQVTRIPIEGEEDRPPAVTGERTRRPAGVDRTAPPEAHMPSGGVVFGAGNEPLPGTLSTVQAVAGAQFRRQAQRRRQEG
ncbi:MAG: hypothetical protein KatS3mg051_0408 [Anaerolineae bacterium]|nr:MAG: hypothetical protein KatS3mg051_0408 [Anaerolineae bacterium]